jgi:hypothetical protein
MPAGRNAPRARQCPWLCPEIDQAAAPLEVVVRQQLPLRDPDEIRIADVTGAIGINQPSGLGEMMDRIGAFRGAWRQAAALEDAEQLQDADAARRWRRHAADAPAAETAADRLALERTIVAQVAET